MNPLLPQPPHDDPEARLTAYILGELSPDEVTALQAELVQNPALAALHRQLQQTIGLLQEAMKAPESQEAPPAPPVTFSQERRAALLDSFKAIPEQRLRAARVQRVIPWRDVSALAAMLLALLILAGAFLIFRPERQGKSAAGLSPEETARFKYIKYKTSGGRLGAPAANSSVPKGHSALYAENKQAGGAGQIDGLGRESLVANDTPTPTTPAASPEVANRGRLSGTNYLGALFYAGRSDAGRLGDVASTDPKPNVSPTLSFGSERKSDTLLNLDAAAPAGANRLEPAVRQMEERLAESDVLAAVINPPAVVPPPAKPAPAPNQQLGIAPADGDAVLKGTSIAASKAPESGSERRKIEADALALQLTPPPPPPAIEPATGLPLEALKRAELRDLTQARPNADNTDNQTQNLLSTIVIPGEKPNRYYAANGPAPGSTPLGGQTVQNGFQNWAEPQSDRAQAGLGRGGRGGGADGAEAGKSQQPPTSERPINLALGDKVNAPEGTVGQNAPASDVSVASRAARVQLSEEKEKSKIVSDPMTITVAPTDGSDTKKLSALQDDERKPAPDLAAVVPEINYQTSPSTSSGQANKQTEELSKRISGKDNSGEDSFQKRRAEAAVPQPDVQTRDNPFSTFSLNVSDVSFKLAAASLENGKLPDAATIRSEEFINAFDYRDPEPRGSAPVSFTYERARYPFAHNRDVVRFALKTAASGRQPGRPLNLVLLLDNSGSMERADRVQIIRECLRVLAAQLRPEDRISVVTFARTPRLWIDGMPGDQAAELAPRVGSLTPQGGTNLEDALNLAYQTALRHFQAGGMNRVVLLTDGAANLGEVDPTALKRKVEAQRRQGIALDCFGIGWEGYNDDLLETLSRNADGRYGFVNTPEAAASEFAGQLAGALQVAASDVKVEVEFNPRRVTVYRQLGYAKHQLTKEQFRDNTVDAAELAAAESGNALYLLELNPQGDGPIGVVRVRFKVPGTSDYREHEWAVPYDGTATALDQSSPSLRLATSSAAFAEWLTGSPFAGEVNPDRLLTLLAQVPQRYANDPRPKKLEWMLRQAKALAK